MKQYPYLLQTKVQGASVDTEGNFIDPGANWVDYCSCRDEAGNGREVRGQDGKSFAFTALIQMPKGVSAITSGTLVRVLDQEGSIRVEGQVVYSRKDQFHTRAWI